MNTVDRYLKIVIASQNGAKIKSVDEVCSKLFKKYTIESYKTQSGVAETPLNDSEAIKGCQNRLRNLKVIEEPDSTIIYISMEGLIQKEEFGCFVFGWVAVKIAGSSQIYYGCSGKVMIPEEIYEKCRSGDKLSAVINNLINFADEDKATHWGTNGLITGGIYTRIDEFSTALKCALGSFIMSNQERLSKFLISTYK